MEYKKFDLHCHTHEGSPDSKVSVEKYIELLKEHGFGGMLITDHDSYEGYRFYKEHFEEEKSFVVLRGIEYDTFEFGHMIVVLPVNTPKEVYQMLEYRGMSLPKLIYLVHRAGGILGPAHPGGEPFLSFGTTKYWRFNAQTCFFSQFDFLEGYNACERELDNKWSRRMASRYNLPLTGGSDAHWEDCVGNGYTWLPDTIQNENDFIQFYRKKNHPKIGGRRFRGTIRDRLGFWNHFLVLGFYYYNKAGALRYVYARHKAYSRAISSLKSNM